MYPVVANVAQPKYYAQYDATTIQIAPTPDVAYAIGFHYFAMPVSIVTAGTSWLGDNFDQVLLYGAMLEAYIFMKGDADVMGYYKAAYDVGLAELKAVVSATKMNNYRG